MSKSELAKRLFALFREAPKKNLPALRQLDEFTDEDIQGALAHIPHQTRRDFLKQVRNAGISRIINPSDLLTESLYNTVPRRTLLDLDEIPLKKWLNDFSKFDDYAPDQSISNIIPTSPDPFSITGSPEYIDNLNRVIQKVDIPTGSTPDMFTKARDIVKSSPDVSKREREAFMSFLNREHYYSNSPDFSGGTPGYFDDPEVEFTYDFKLDRDDIVTIESQKGVVNDEYTDISKINDLGEKDFSIAQKKASDAILEGNVANEKDYSRFLTKLTKQARKSPESIFLLKQHGKLPSSIKDALSDDFSLFSKVHPESDPEVEPFLEYLRKIPYSDDLVGDRITFYDDFKLKDEK